MSFAECMASRSLPNIEIMSAMLFDQYGTIGVIEEIGSGTYSRVYRCSRIHEDKNSEVAIKIITSPRESQTDQKNFTAELMALQALQDHPNIIKWYGVVKDGPYLDSISDEIGFSLEYCPNGDLYHYMKRSSPISPQRAHRWIIEMLSAISYLHRQTPSMVHRDIKSGNFLIDSNHSIRLTDFGLIRPDTEFHRLSTLKKTRTTIMYAPPETLISDKSDELLVYTTKSDVYSVTIVIWELLNYCLNGTYSLPFKIEHAFSVVGLVRRKVRPNISNPPFSEGWIDFLTEGWAHQQDDRPDVDSLLERSKLLEIIEPSHQVDKSSVVDG